MDEFDLDPEVVRRLGYRAADLVADRLSRLGVDDALREAGARPGDTVRIGDIEFEFREEDG